MAAAALTPRVRLMAICDGVRESKTEAGVFNVKGLRQRIVAQTFPFVPLRLRLFLVFSSPRPGEFPGYVLVINDKTDKTILYGDFTPHPKFEGNQETVVNVTRLRCLFPQPGRYTVQVWFFQDQGPDVLKGELPFTISEGGGWPMKKIAGKKMLGPTLQEIELVPITDPIRLAAIDRRRKAVQRATAAADRNSAKRKSSKRK